MRNFANKILISWLIAGVTLVCVFISDQARGRDFTPVTATQCTSSYCTSNFSTLIAAFEERVEKERLIIWSDIDFCAASISILEESDGSGREMQIPERLATRGVIALDTTDAATQVSPGPSIESLWFIAWNGLQSQGPRSCHMSNYGALGIYWIYGFLALSLIGRLTASMPNA